MNRNILTSFIPVLALSLCLVLPSVVSAQTSDLSDPDPNKGSGTESAAVDRLELLEKTAIEPTDSGIVQKKKLDAEILEVRRTYRGQLEEYRQAEQKFTVAKEQFEKLNTLVSLETAVQATKVVMQKRAQVLHTYLTLLRLELLNSEGVNLPLRDAALSNVEKQLKIIENHQDLLVRTTDRNAVNNAADDFELISTDYQIVTSYAVSLLKVSQLQLVYDKSNALAKVLATESSSSSSTLNQAEITRANEEVSRQLLEVKGIIDEQVAILSNTKNRTNTINAGDIEEIYTKLLQSALNLKELARLLYER